MQNIFQAYRTRARDYHPDKNQGNEDKIKMFYQLQEAYDWIMDPGIITYNIFY